MTEPTVPLNPAPAPAPAPQTVVVAAPRKPLWKRILTWLFALIFVLSIFMNFGLMALLALTLTPESGLRTTVVQKGSDSQVVALYKVGGVIDGEASGTFDRFFRDIKDNANVKAVVIRVDSPGGSVSDSDRIQELVKRLRAGGKKVVVSMGGVAASGGYYISAPADEIWAEPTTVTGSIGVIMMWPVLKGTMEKIGVDMRVLRATPVEAWKAVPNTFEEPAPYQIASLQETLNAMMTRFETVVKSGRGSKLKVSEPTMQEFTDAAGKTFKVTSAVPFNGKVYMAEEAKKLGLVDQIGYQEDAISAAAKLAGLSNPKVMQYAPRHWLFGELASSKAGPLIDVKAIEQLQTPKIMMLWKVD